MQHAFQLNRSEPTANVDSIFETTPLVSILLGGGLTYSLVVSCPLAKGLLPTKSGSLIITRQTSMVCLLSPHLEDDYSGEDCWEVDECEFKVERKNRGVQKAHG